MPRLQSAPVVRGSLSSTVQAALGFLQEQGGSGWVVGGWLRDAVLGRHSNDVDLAVQGDPLGLAEALARRFGGTCVLIHEAPIIARVVLREDGQAWRLDLTALQGSLEQDLARRDFTVDALALPLERLLEGWSLGDVVDPLGGLEDLEQRRIRAASEGVFQEDPVRLLRAVRLAAQLGFQVEPGTLRLMERDAARVGEVAGERVRDELFKVLEAPEVARHLRLLDRVGVLSRVLPELEVGRGVKQPPEHYWDVLHHNIETAGMVERLLDRPRVAEDPLLSLAPWPESLESHLSTEVCDGFSRRVFLKAAALLHDVGKPATRSVEDSGRIRFLGHQEVGAAMAAEALGRLRVGGRGVRLVEAMVRHHMRPGQLSQEGQPPTRRAVYRFSREAGEATLDTLYLNLADYLAARGPRLEAEDWGLRCRTVAAVLELLHQQEVAGPPKLVDGHGLMESLGLGPGPLVGRLLEVVREAQAAGEVATREEALALSRRVLDQLGGDVEPAAPSEEGEEQE